MNRYNALDTKNIKLWSVLAFQAGAINAGGFIACHRFVTHTTGFATHFGFEIAHNKWKEGLGLLIVPLFFLFGAMITSYFVDLPHRKNQRPNFITPILLIFLSLLTATILGELGAFGIFGDDMILKKDILLMVLLCLASGLQNALFTNSQGSSVRTTHLTGITTELAVGIIRIFFSAHDSKEINRDKLYVLSRSGIIVAFIFGSTLSTFLFLKIEYLGFILPVFTCLGVLKYFYKDIEP